MTITSVLLLVASTAFIYLGVKWWKDIFGVKP